MDASDVERCPRCGAIADEVWIDGTRHCAACASDVSLDIPTVRHTYTVPEAPPSRSNLHFGLSTEIAGEEFRIVGRVFYSAADSWEEWVLESQSGHTHFLENYDNSWVLWSTYDPQVLLSEESLRHARPGDRMTIDNLPCVVVEAGPCRISGVSGTIPWQLVPDEPNRFTDFDSNGRLFSVEFNGGRSIDWFHGTRMSAAEVHARFSATHEADPNESPIGTGLSDSEINTSPASRRAFAWVCLVAAFVALAMQDSALHSGSSLGTVVIPASSVGPSGVTVGPFGGGYYSGVGELEVVSDIRDYAGWVEGDIVRGPTPSAPNQSPYVPTTNVLLPGIGAAERTYFRLHDHRTYYVHVRSSPEPTSAANIYVTLADDVTYPGYYMWFAVPITLVGLFHLIPLSYLRRKNVS